MGVCVTIINAQQRACRTTRVGKQTAQEDGQREHDGDGDGVDGACR